MKIDILNTFLVLTVLVSGLVEASLAQPVEPIAHWRADGSTENSSGGPSIIGNPALSYEQGVLGQAFSCTLNSPPIATDLDAQQSAMRSSTWSCWINAKDPGRGTRRQILSVDDGGFDRSLLLDNEFISAFTGTTSWQVAQVRPGEWTHVAVVWRRHSVVCYINGEAFEYKGKLSEQSTMRKLSIGRSPSFGERFIGLIDDIQIFDRALSEEDLLKLYEQGRLHASSVQAQTINGTPASASLPGPAAAPEVAKPGSSAPPASEALRVDSAAAAAHIGKHVIARGNVAAIGKSTYTGLSYINFGKPYPDMELAACFATSDTNLANLKELEGRQGVEIEGTISADGRGRPQIIVTSPEQVKSRGEPPAQRPSSQTAEDSNRSASAPARTDGATEGRVMLAKAAPNSDAPESASSSAPVATITLTAPTTGSARTEKLREPAAFPVVVNGRKAGETKIAAGTVVAVLEEKGDRVLLKSGSLEPHWFPLSKITDPPPPPPTTFSFPVDGEMTQFTRWGSGDKLIVFFNNHGRGDNGPDGRFDMMPKEIERALHAYAPLLREGYSLVVWDYPDTGPGNMRFWRCAAVAWSVDMLDDKPDFSGIASSVVEGIRKETRASEMLLVGNSMGAGVLLWDLDKLSSMSGIRTLLVSPTEAFMPSPDQLSNDLSKTTLIALQPDHFLKDPKIKAWAAKHASPPEGTLKAGRGHLIVGQNMTHDEVVRLIRMALQPASKRSTSSNN